MRLIVTEKDNSAKKIAQILSDGKAKQDKSYGIPHYGWDDEEGGQRVIGLKGHLMNPAFPEGYSEWRKVEPRELIDAQLDQGARPEERPQGHPQAGQGRRHGRDRDRLRPRGRADRPGGARGDPRREPEARREREPRRRGVKRARYSALTKEEIEEAFTNLVELSEPLARAGEARQDIDLIWGATLTRFVSLATGRLGSQFLSVGRVQSPTLAIVVERELERRAHVPKPYWEVWAAFEHPDGVFTAHHKVDKFWEEAEAKAALENTRSPGRRQVGRVAAQHAQAAVAVQHDRVHERRVVGRRLAGPRDAHRRGPLHGRLHLLSAHGQHRVPEVAAGARAAAVDLPGARFQGGGSRSPTRPELNPTRGKKETTDHPPIYPTQALDPTRAARRRPPQDLRAGGAPLPRPRSPTRRCRSPRAPTSRPAPRPTSCAGTCWSSPASWPSIRTGARKDEEIPKVEEGQQLALADRAARRAASGRRGGRRRGSAPQPVVRRQGDAAAVAHRPGQADRDDGGARPRHEGHAPRHHPEALRPRLRAEQPDRAVARPGSRW